MSRVVPMLQGHPDRAVAEAISECQLRPDAFKVTYEVNGESLDTEFPPKPAYLSAISIGYLENRSRDIVRRQFTMLPGDGVDMEEVARTHSKGYEQLVTPIQANASELPHAHQVDLVRPYAINLARQDRLRTVGAFVTFSSIKGDEHFNGFVVSKRATLELPLIVRSWIVDWLGGTTDEANPLAQLNEDERNAMQAYLRNDEKLQKLASIVACTSMPEIEKVKRSSEIWLAGQRQMEAGGQRPPARIDYENDKYAGLARSERRKLQAKERRDETKRRNRKPSQE